MSNLLSTPEPTSVTIPCLALRPREAAVALSLSERKLWELTNCGKVPHVRIGKALLYPVDALRRWLDEQASGKKGGGR